MILYIILAILVASGLAYVVVKYLPLKYRWVVSLFLIAASIFLAVKIYNGIMTPINFNKEKVVRFAKVIKNLKIIRDAQVDYYEVMGSYTDNEEVLISFIDTAKRAITEMRDTVIRVNKGTRWQPVMVDVEKRIKDTIAFESILIRYKDRDYKTMFSVPGVKGKKFELSVGTVEKVPGFEVSVFEAKTDKESILEGMDASLIKLEKEAKTTDEIKGEYVSVGSLYDVTTGGNWPPAYDKNDAAKKDQ